MNEYGLSDAVVEELRGVFQLFPDIIEVHVFGSRAKGNYTEHSDIDLAVTSDKGRIPFDELMDINLRIEDLGLLYKVDVIDYRKSQGSPIGDHIDRVGRVLYRRGPNLQS